MQSWMAITIPGNICVASTPSRILFDPATRSRARAQAAADPSKSATKAASLAMIAEFTSWWDGPRPVAPTRHRPLESRDRKRYDITFAEPSPTARRARFSSAGPISTSLAMEYQRPCPTTNSLNARRVASTSSQVTPIS